MDVRPRPTLLIFTLGPGREHARRRWLSRGFEAPARALHERCLDEVLRAGREAGCRLRVCTPAGERLAPDAEIDDQPEAGFSGRLLGAVRRARRRAAGPLVVVGTDTPGIDAALLEGALESLRRAPDAVVVGPAADGGIYLLAANDGLTGALAETEWRSRRTLESLLAALRRAGREVRLLPVRNDLDTRRDLERWVFHGAAALAAAWSDVVAALRCALVHSTYAAPAPALASASTGRRSRSTRAPPR